MKFRVKYSDDQQTPYVFIDHAGMCFRAFLSSNGGYAVFRGDFLLGHVASVVHAVNLIAQKFCSNAFRSGINYAESGSHPMTGDHALGFYANCLAWQIDERLFDTWSREGGYFVADSSIHATPSA